MALYLQADWIFSKKLNNFSGLLLSGNSWIMKLILLPSLWTQPFIKNSLEGFVYG